VHCVGCPGECTARHAASINLRHDAEDGQSLQVYSPEVLQAFGQALVKLLKDMMLYMRAMEATGISHDTSEWLPRLIFLLLQNPLNGQRSPQTLNQNLGVLQSLHTMQHGTVQIVPALKASECDDVPFSSASVPVAHAMLNSSVAGDAVNLQ